MNSEWRTLHCMLRTVACFFLVLAIRASAADHPIEKPEDGHLPWTAGRLASKKWENTVLEYAEQEGDNFRIVSKRFTPPPPWKFVGFDGAPIMTRVDVYGDPGSPTIRTLDGATEIKITIVYENKTAAQFPFAAEGNLGTQGGGGPGSGGGKYWAVREGELGLIIEYRGGKDTTNGQLEEDKQLLGDYLLKGYILKCTCLGAGENEVTWTFKKGDTEVGTFHESHAWTHYASALATKPTAATVYWRPDFDAGGNISDVYTIKATYGTPPVAVQRTLKSRSLAPDDQYVRDRFNEDTDMLQRAMIQIFFLDKGRLNRYFIGKYTKNVSGSEASLYRSSLPSRVSAPLWSAIADEVENLDHFTLNSGTSKTLLLRHVTGLWEEFGRILAAGDIGAVTTAHPDYSDWRSAAITASGLTMPQGFAKTPAQYVDGVATLESTGKHSYVRFDPLAVNNIQVGENAGGSPVHTWTDDGLGFMKVQPYNRATCNLYKPDDNLLRGSQMLAGLVGAAPGVNPSEKAWRAYVKYNSGDYGTGTPQQMRAALSKPAFRADKLFNILGLSASVSGTVTKGGQPLEGVTIAVTCQVFTGKTTTTQNKATDTAIDGTYTVPGMVLNQTITVVPSKAGETFTPASRSVAIGDANATGQDFKANVSISGIGTKGGVGLVGVTVSTGTGLSAVTGAGGTYTIGNVPPNQAYTLLPTKDGEMFTPETRDVNVGETDVGGQNFTVN